MRKFLWILMVFLVGNIWAKALNGTASNETREFEFELTDLYYPLLSEEQTKELGKKMISAYTWGLYEGNITETYSDSFRKDFNPLRRVLVPKSGTNKSVYKLVGSSKAYLKDGKVRFVLPKEMIIDDGIGTEIKWQGTIPLQKLQISMPIHYLGETLNEKLYTDKEGIYSNDGHYFTLNFSITPYVGKEPSYGRNGFYTRQHSYIEEFMVPMYNAIVGGTSGSNFYSLSGAKLWAVGKISEVNKDGSLSDKPLVANESEYGSRHLSDSPLLTYGTKIWSIPSAAYNDQGTENISLTKNIPANMDNISARYINRGVLEQFALYGDAKYKSANSSKYDKRLTNMMIAQTKVRGKLYRIEGQPTYNKNYNRFETDSNCLFEYGIQFLGDRELRYLSRPKSVDNRDNKYENWRYGEITADNISAISEFEQDMRQWFVGQEDEKAKVAACQELLTHAKHLLTASKEQLNREFGETYKSVGTQYEKVITDRAEHAKWLANRNGEYVTKNPNGEILRAWYKEGKLVNATLRYPNGNVFRYSYSGSPWNGIYRGDKVDNVTMTYPNGNVFRYYVEGVLDDNLPLSNITFEGKLITYEGDRSRSCSAPKFVNGKAEGDGGSYSNDNIDLRVYYRDGLANGYSRLSINDKSGKLYRYLYFTGETKDGKFEGKAYVNIGNLDFNESRYDNVTFTDGFISDKRNLEDVYVDLINSYLKALYPIECDVNKRLVFIN